MPSSTLKAMMTDSLSASALCVEPQPAKCSCYAQERPEPCSCKVMSALKKLLKLCVSGAAKEGHTASAVQVAAMLSQ